MKRWTKYALADRVKCKGVSQRAVYAFLTDKGPSEGSAKVIDALLEALELDVIPHGEGQVGYFTWEWYTQHLAPEKPATK